MTYNERQMEWNKNNKIKFCHYGTHHGLARNLKRGHIVDLADQLNDYCTGSSSSREERCTTEQREKICGRHSLL
jgi:hypothetical protein